MRRLFSFLTLFVLLSAAPAVAQEQRVTEGQTARVTAPESDIPLLVYTVQTDNGSAKAEDGDYKPLPGTQTVMPGEEVPVETLEDSSPERDEDFVVRFSMPTDGEPVEKRVVIADDDLPRATIEDGAALESAGVVGLKIGLTPVDRPSSLNFRADNGSATDGADFRDAAGTLEIPAGASEATLRIPIVDDDVDEDDEQFTVRLEATDDADIGDDGAATVSIGDDDFRSLSIADANAREGDGENVVTRVPVTLSAPTFRTVTVQYATLDGVARAPIDYLSRLGTLTFAPGETQKFVDLAVVSDERKEGTELFGVLLGKEQGAVLQRGAAVISVEDDDAEPNPDDAPPAMRIAKPKLKGRSVSVRVTCPRAETRCKGRLTLFTVADRKAKARSLRRERRLGRKSYSLAGGQGKTVKMTLSKTLVAAARASGRLRVRAFALTSDPADNVDTSQRSATLRFKRTMR